MPELESVPFTLRVETGDVVPIQTLPPCSNIAEFTIELVPEYFGTTFTVPPVVVTV